MFYKKIIAGKPFKISKIILVNVRQFGLRPKICYIYIKFLEHEAKAQKVFLLVKIIFLPMTDWPTDLMTSQPTNRHSQIKSCYHSFKKSYALGHGQPSYYFGNLSLRDEFSARSLSSLQWKTLDCKLSTKKQFII